MKTLNFFTTLLTATSDAASETSAEGMSAGMATLIQLGLPLLIIGFMMYFMMYRPETKRRKAEKQMLDELMVGDEVVTKGGIIGKVVNIKDDAVTVETGADKCRIRVKRWAIGSVQSNKAEK